MKAIPGEVQEINRLGEEERQSALRALLRHPLLIAERAEHREDFAKVRRHAETLRVWFARYTGWTLEVDGECARLFKVPARLEDATHPALAKDELPFTRRRYVLLCLALAVLVKTESQTTLGQLARTIVELWNENSVFAHLSFDLDATDSRRDLIAAVRLLSEYHAITPVDGDEQRFLHHREQEVLYDVHHHIIFRLLAARRAPNAIIEDEWPKRLEALVAEPAIDEEEQRNQRFRHYFGRRLLDDPVLYLPSDLSQEAQEYFLRQRSRILQTLVDATDLVPEDRRDGVALSDRTGDCTDIGLPEEGTDGHATLLTAEYLGALRLEQPGDIVPYALIENFLAGQAEKNRGFWRKDATAPGAEATLAREAVRRLASLDLVRCLRDGVVVMPAIHRYRHELRVPTTEAPSTEN